ncbi:hypothetical protein [Hallella seregens]|uniref:Uncharacterized protein n=1 Tax=Hallella seregens ATCC 51272 TaxID=1336250 RepID=A0ABV5ZGQ2_9BACT|nr:hypothetical protein [Hallella seregens]
MAENIGDETAKPTKRKGENMKKQAAKLVFLGETPYICRVKSRLSPPGGQSDPSQT